MPAVVSHDLTPVNATGRAGACPDTASLEHSILNEQAPGGGLPQVRSGNLKAARVSANVAGPSKKAKIRRRMEMGSSLG